MTFAVRLTALAALLVPMAAWSQAQQPTAAPESVGKSGLDYVMLQTSVINYSSIGPTKGTAETYAIGITLGTYISDYFKVEVRAGGGFSEETVSYLPPPPRGREQSEEDRVFLDVSMPYYASWYMGLLYPWSDYSHIYGQFGFSHVKGEAETETPNRFEDVSDKLFGSSFSVSWLIGLDLELTDNTYAVLEGGRLHTDTETGINAMQYSLGVRYEF